MSATMATVIGVSFLLIVLFTGWLKYHEHLHLHRHDHGEHSSRTDKRPMLYRLSESGMMRRLRGNHGGDADHEAKTRSSSARSPRSKLRG